jgi:ribonuclease P protein component
MQPVNRNLRRRQRLTRSALFGEAYAQGRRFVGRFMVLWLREAEDAALRLGVVAGRKVGEAVVRNRAKRRLREAFRLNRQRLHGKADVILIARRTVVNATWQELESELLRLAAEAGLL